MSLTWAGPSAHGATTVDGGEVICLHEYARLRSRMRECDRDDLAVMTDVERNVQAQYARLATRIRSRTD